MDDRFSWAAEEIAARRLRLSMFDGFSADQNDDNSANFLDYLVQQEPSTSSADDLAKVLLILKEKERDLELTARIGASLLEQNKELQERNEFLEESLSSTNESVIQLKHELRQRNNFFRELAHLSEEDDGEKRPESISPNVPSTSSASQHLQDRVKALEEENNRLKTEAARLEDLSIKVEERERSRVKHYIGQLEQARLKISLLQSQITEKNHQCDSQTKEIKKLMHEVGERRDREQELLDSNIDLNVQLSDAVQNHESLRSDMSKLQDQYLEVMGILQETEDELRIYRQRMSAIYRTSSVDSLYDSLASELEASDSGCYNTPQFSARFDGQQSLPDREHNPMSLQLERLRTDCSPIAEALPSPSVAHDEPEMEGNDAGHCSRIEINLFSDLNMRNDAETATEPFEIPSHAFVNAFKKCILDDELKRPSRDRSALVSKSNSTRHSVCEFSGDEDGQDFDRNCQPENSDLIASEVRFPSLSSILHSNSIEQNCESKDNTPVVDTMSFSTISCQSVNTVIPAAPSISSLNNKDLMSSSIGCARSDGKKNSSLKNINGGGSSSNLSDRRASVSSYHVRSDYAYVPNGKVCRNTSCSPIHFDAKSVVKSAVGTLETNQNSDRRNSAGKIDSQSLWKRKALLRYISSDGNKMDVSKDDSMGELWQNSGELDKSSSSESLSSTNSTYDKPKLGEPGRLGTRDLDQSLRRLKLKKKIELDYAAFRRRRGLPPSKFGFHNFAVLSTTETSAPALTSPQMFGVLSSQINAMSVKKCQNCATITSTTLISRAHGWLRSFRQPRSKLPPLPSSTSSKSICGPQVKKFWGNKSKTVNDISSALLAPPSPTDNTASGSTIVRRTLAENDIRRRRTSSLSKMADANDSPANVKGNFERSHLQGSLRTSSLSPCKARTIMSPSSSISYYGALTQPNGLIAGFMGSKSRMSPITPRNIGTADFDKDMTGLNCLSTGLSVAFQVSDSSFNSAQNSTEFGVFRRVDSTEVNNICKTST